MDGNRPAPDDYSSERPQFKKEPASRRGASGAAGKPLAVSASPFVWVEPSLLPHRQWLYGRHLVRKYVSATIAPGGVGKSTLGMVDAVAMASGRQLLNDKPFGPLRVWCWNGEDDSDELRRRVSAAMLHHEVDPSELEGRLFLDSGRTTPIKIGSMQNGAIAIATPVVDALEAEIKRLGIDVLIIDPFVSAHSLPENGNEAMDAAVKAFASIADHTGCAIDLVHHARKLNGQDADIDSARGGSAIAAAVRAARVLNVMGADAAKGFNVSAADRRSYVRVDDAKANLAPTRAARWIHLVGVPLGNIAPGREGDWVASCELWTPPDAMAGITLDHLLAVQREVDGKQFRENVQAKNWVGHAVGKVLSLNSRVEPEKTKIKDLIRAWVNSGALEEAIIQDAQKGRDVKILEVGKWADRE
ncbi:recombinase RecA [Mesorhizobium sp. M6A.T.Ce.TU.002.03.1.1]|uniref:AAA family ATPase n=1 Tax=Mesorhizobium sp. M6A.T.Ce.TU.002.03.1.1 TaxID=2496782 RepID=UPI000FCC4F52|nr:AAA family ATPase [Mesorhizobium sp. M6A.T.Ce.TU.002.03.1.1]RUU46623.1 recombinase RecA [Mesorhizobium sp. M6A.T.Ce.TU.002.03.1.1]